jgi:hypothetical protein
MASPLNDQRLDAQKGYEKLPDRFDQRNGVDIEARQDLAGELEGAQEGGEQVWAVVCPRRSA